MIRNQFTRQQRNAFTLAEVLLVALVMSLLVSNLLPAINACREAARRSQCKNRLMQLGVALHSYHLTHASFPPGCVNSTGPVVNHPDGYHASWILQSLPYIEQSNLAARRDPRLSVYDEDQLRLLVEHPIALLVCPSEVIEDRVRDSNFVGVTGGLDEPIDQDNTGILFLNTCVSQADIIDGTSQTLLIGERQIPTVDSVSKMTWLSGTSETLRNTAVPLNANATLPTFTPAGFSERIFQRTQSLSNWRTGGFGSHHAGGAQFCLADGSVRFISENIDREVFSSCGNRNDGGPFCEW